MDSGLVHQAVYGFQQARNAVEQSVARKRSTRPSSPQGAALAVKGKPKSTPAGPVKATRKASETAQPPKLRGCLLWYIVLNTVQDARRPAATKNPADFLPYGGGSRASEGVARRAG